jgi:hypothetical protein
MHARQVLALPELTELEGMNPREPLCKADPWTEEPVGLLQHSFNGGRKFEPKDGYGNAAASRSAIESAKKQLRTVLVDSFNLLNKPPGEASGYFESGGGGGGGGGGGININNINDPNRSSANGGSTGTRAGGVLTKPDYWAGLWTPLVDKNEKKIMHWLPNDQFVSSHLAMVAHLGFIEGALGNEWV